MNLIRQFFKVFGIFLLTLGLFWGCSRDMSPLMSDQNNTDQNMVNYQPTPDEAGAYALTLLDMTLKLSANGLTNYQELKEPQPNLKLSSTGGMGQIHVVDYRFENGMHIWQGTLDFDRYQDTLEIHFERKIQFRSAQDGEVLRYSAKADYMYLYYRLWGKFGFVNGEKYGEKFDHFIEGEWTGLVNGLPTFNAQGRYDDLWSGIYNGEDVVFHYLINIEIDQLKFRLENPDVGYRLDGRVLLSMLPFFAEAVCNGGPSADVTVYRWGNPVWNFEFPIPNLYGWELTRDFGGPLGNVPYLKQDLHTLQFQLR